MRFQVLNLGDAKGLLRFQTQGLVSFQNLEVS